MSSCPVDKSSYARALCRLEPILLLDHGRYITDSRMLGDTMQMYGCTSVPYPHCVLSSFLSEDRRVFAYESSSTCLRSHILWRSPDRDLSWVVIVTICTPLNRHCRHKCSLLSIVLALLTSLALVYADSWYKRTHNDNVPPDLMFAIGRTPCLTNVRKNDSDGQK